MLRLLNGKQITVSCLKITTSKIDDLFEWNAISRVIKTEMEMQVLRYVCDISAKAHVEVWY